MLQAQQSKSTVQVLSKQKVLLDSFSIQRNQPITQLHSQVYVDYERGDPKIFWKNLAFFTGSMVLGQQLAPIQTTENFSNSIQTSLLFPSISLAFIPNILHNRPRGIPEVNLRITHLNEQGSVLNTWEKPLTKDAKKGPMLLDINLDTTLTSGKIEVSLENNSKRKVAYWANESLFKVVPENNSSVTYQAVNTDYTTNSSTLHEKSIVYSSLAPNEPLQGPTCECGVGYYYKVDNGNWQASCITCPTTPTPTPDPSPPTSPSNGGNVATPTGNTQNGGYGAGSNGFNRFGGISNCSYCTPQAPPPTPINPQPILPPHSFNRYDRPEKRFEVYENRCTGLKNMWEYSFRSNDIFTTKEMNGFITTNGSVIILPSMNNDYENCIFKGSYSDAQGREIVYVYRQQGVVKVSLTSYSIDGNPTTVTYDVSATVHTHPYTDTLVHDTYNPSPNDRKSIATGYSDLKNFLLTPDKIVEYNSTGKSSESPHNCY